MGTGTKLSSFLIKEDSPVEADSSREAEVIVVGDGDILSHLAAALSDDKDISKGIPAVVWILSRCSGRR